MIRILVVDDQVLFRDALVKLINSQPDMKVVAAANEAKEAPAICEDVSPDLVLMDILTDPAPQNLFDPAGPTGIGVTAQIRQQFPNIKVIIMTGLSEVTIFDAAKKAGAHSLIYKNIHDERFLSNIRSTMEGYSTFPEIAPAQLPFLFSFSDREMKVLRFFCQGKTRSEIAGELCVSEALIKAIVTSLLNKTGFDSVLRLAVYLTSSGYIMPNIEN
jgi:DNA-binding NarL/FixJ family response regulator